MQQTRPSQYAAGPVIGFARKIIEYWALAGGGMLLAIVLVTAASMTGGILFNAPVPGDFEIVEVGVAIAVFSFLPYCQITGSNVTADIFTANASQRTIAVLALLSSTVAVVFSLILLWRMNAGLADYREYEEVTAINGFPIWIAFIPILVSLTLLAVAALITLIESVGTVRRGDVYEQRSAGDRPRP